MTRDGTIEVMAGAMAMYFCGNNMPHMSGDPFARLSAMQKRNCFGAAKAALSAIEAKGHDILPVEPTDAMIEAAKGAPMTKREAYRAMVARYRGGE